MYLLDTHVFLWATARSKKLPSTVASTIEDADNDVFVSAVSFWEIAIKVRAGKLDIGKHDPADLPSRAMEIGFNLLDLEADEAAATGQLGENTHFDPFDRMLVWQAINRGLTLVTADTTLKRFKSDGLKLLWK
ncbi:MAG TPA: type II toxin-antitoxin system VapC family toxin [Pyrinomonadaceae bacterium]|jgi:PIN domain nuclease of toxin-antitoxin system|nr:type II toxin-antitoxin system VapC family toxin [Pyrinomonadaceae bacterium]